MNSTNQNKYRYLPVRAGGRTLGIPFAVIERILMRSELPAPQPASNDGASLQPGDAIITINLARLMTDGDLHQEQAPIVIVNAVPQRLALVVDSVAPMKTVDMDSYFVMPAIFGASQTPFGGVIRDQENLTLMIDPDLISHMMPAVEDRPVENL